MFESSQRLFEAENLSADDGALVVAPGALDQNEDDLLPEAASRFAFARRFAHNRGAVAGLGMLGIIILLAIFAPLLSGGYIPSTDSGFSNPFFLQTNIQPTLLDFPERIFGLTTLADYHNPVFIEVIFAARTTLVISIGGAIIALVIGTALGSISGYYGGFLDAAIMRVTDLALTFPFMPLVIALLIASNTTQMTVQSLMLIFGLAGWAQTARLVRVQMLTLRGQSFTEAAQATGVSDGRIIVRHLLPNAVSVLITVTTLNVANFILAEANLEYLNLVRIGNFYTWGLMIANGERYILQNYWWWTVIPGVFIVLTVLSINAIGEGIRDAFDVRGQQKF